MLSKLIKHEFKATGRVMLPLLAAVLVLAALSGVSVIMLDRETDYGFMNVIFVLILIGFFLCLFALGIMSLVLMIQRFYKNLLGSEGYLMFTLPVSVDALVWAKLIVSFVWFVVTGFICVLALLLMAVIGASFAFSAEDIALLWKGTTDAFRLVGFGNVIGYALEVIASLFIWSVFTCLQFYLSMAIGQSFSTHRGLISVASFFAISIVLSILGGTGLAILSSSGLADSAGSMLDAAAESSVFTAVHIVFLINILIGAAAGALLYFPAAALLKKKLNLA